MFKFWITFLMLLMTAIISPSSARAETLKSELKQLKSLCDADLLSKKQCELKREEIWNKFKGNKIRVTGYCNYNGSADKSELKNLEEEISSGKDFSQDANPLQVVKEIIDAAGLAPNFITIARNKGMASASLAGSRRYISYNPKFFRRLKSAGNTNWTVYSVMAHEVGHHLNGHTLRPGGSRPDSELEADEWSGFILAKMGASLDDAQIAMREIGSRSGSSTHPPRDERLEAIERGWNRGHGKKVKPITRRRTKTDRSGPRPIPLTPPVIPQRTNTAQRCGTFAGPVCFLPLNVPYGFPCWCQNGFQRLHGRAF